MKKIAFLILGIILIIILGFGIKNLLDLYSNEEAQEEKDFEDDEGWEIEAEYNYNGTMSENELQYFEMTEENEKM